MELLLWVILGVISGYLASIIMGTNSTQGPIMDMVLGVIGAFVGGFVLNLFGASGVNGFNIYSILVATLGAVTLIWLGRVLNRTI